MNELVFTLSLCKKAKKLVLGMDPVVTALKEKKLVAVFLGCDLSQNSKKEIEFYCTKYETETVTLPLNMNEIWYAVGKRAGIVGITDQGLYNKLRTILIKLNGEETI